MNKNTKILIAVIVLVMLSLWYFVIPKLTDKETTKVEYKDTIQTVIVDSFVIDSLVVDSIK
jgi:type II secretory pathway component PulF